MASPPLPTLINWWWLPRATPWEGFHGERALRVYCQLSGTNTVID